MDARILEKLNDHSLVPGRLYQCFNNATGDSIGIGLLIDFELESTLYHDCSVVHFLIGERVYRWQYVKFEYALHWPLFGGETSAYCWEPVRINHIPPEELRYLFFKEVKDDPDEPR